jgi:hypothetical protein
MPEAAAYQHWGARGGSGPVPPRGRHCYLVIWCARGLGMALVSTPSFSQFVEDWLPLLCCRLPRSAVVCAVAPVQAR